MDVLLYLSLAAGLHMFCRSADWQAVFGSRCNLKSLMSMSGACLMLSGIFWMASLLPSSLLLRALI
jgi:hypothetical protein